MFSSSSLSVSVSALVDLANASEGDKVNFADALKHQIMSLQKELCKQQANPFGKEGISSKAEGNTEINAVAQPEMVIPGSLPRGCSHPFSKIPTDHFQDTFKSVGQVVPTEPTPWPFGTTRIVRDSPNRDTPPDPNPPPVMRIKFDSRAESSRGKASQTPTLLAAPPCAYPKAVKSMPGTLPVSEPLPLSKPFSTVAPKQL